MSFIFVLCWIQVFIGFTMAIQAVNKKSNGGNGTPLLVTLVPFIAKGGGLPILAGVSYWACLLPFLVSLVSGFIFAGIFIAIKES